MTHNMPYVCVTWLMTCLICVWHDWLYMRDTTNKYEYLWSTIYTNLWLGSLLCVNRSLLSRIQVSFVTNIWCRNHVILIIMRDMTKWWSEPRSTAVYITCMSLFEICLSHIHTHTHTHTHLQFVSKERPISVSTAVCMRFFVTWLSHIHIHTHNHTHTPAFVSKERPISEPWSTAAYMTCMSLFVIWLFLSHTHTHTHTCILCQQRDLYLSPGAQRRAWHAWAYLWCDHPYVTCPIHTCPIHVIIHMWHVPFRHSGVHDMHELNGTCHIWMITWMGHVDDHITKKWMTTSQISSWHAWAYLWCDHPYVTCPIHTWHDSFMCDMTWLIHVWHNSFMNEMTNEYRDECSSTTFLQRSSLWRELTCDMTHCNMTHCNMTHSCVTWHHSSMCDIIRVWMKWLTNGCRDEYLSIAFLQHS